MANKVTFSKEQIENGLRIYDKFRLRDYSALQTMATIGNVMRESSLKSDTTNGRTHGFPQWLGPRKEAFFKYAKANNLDIYSPDAQIEYMLYELSKGEYRNAGKHFRSTKTLSDAVRSFGQRYEKFAPKPYNYDSEESKKEFAKREYWAKLFLSEVLLPHRQAMGASEEEITTLETILNPPKPVKKNLLQDFHFPIQTRRDAIPNIKPPVLNTSLDEIPLRDDLIESLKREEAKGVPYREVEPVESLSNWGDLIDKDLLRQSEFNPNKDSTNQAFTRVQKELFRRAELTDTISGI